MNDKRTEPILGDDFKIFLELEKKEQALRIAHSRKALALEDLLRDLK